jgi:hypothetical protein
MDVGLEGRAERTASALFIWLIIRLIQLIFSVGTIFFSQKKSANSVFQPAYNFSRTAPRGCAATGLGWAHGWPGRSSSRPGGLHGRPGERHVHPLASGARLAGRSDGADGEACEGGAPWPWRAGGERG